MKRTQLNVSIDPELLQKIKETAKLSGKSLVVFVSDCLTNQLKGVSTNSIDSRFSDIEDRINSLEESILFITNKSQKKTPFTPEEAKKFNEFIKAVFKKELQKKQYKSSKHAWNDLLSHINCFEQWNETCSFRLKESLFIEDGDPLSSDEMNLLHKGKICPSPIRTGIINWINNSKKGKCCCSNKKFPSEELICEKGSVLVKNL